MRLELLNWSFADRDSEPSSIAPADVVRLPDTVTTKSSFLHDFRDSPPDIRYKGIAVLQIRRFQDPRHNIERREVEMVVPDGNSNEELALSLIHI